MKKIKEFILTSRIHEFGREIIINGKFVDELINKLYEGVYFENLVKFVYDFEIYSYNKIDIRDLSAIPELDLFSYINSKQAFYCVPKDYLIEKDKLLFKIPHEIGNNPLEVIPNIINYLVSDIKLHMSKTACNDLIKNHSNYDNFLNQQEIKRLKLIEKDELKKAKVIEIKRENDLQTFKHLNKVYPDFKNLINTQ